ncbi:MAG TPA: dihydroorotate dehydrogenase electron transfer subunit [Polyangia bacterium]|jgi:dihydroorotate dehydrogenase electron transfer subunit|nr:dihydroorotate dehydrogenase electron transfer subunit [Polyangia bacterium]
MRYFEAKILENRPLGGGYFVLRLGNCQSLGEARPGQFVMLRGDWERDPLLPRAFSLLSVGSDGTAEVLAKTVGRGTALLERVAVGAAISVLGPLGSSFPGPSPEFIDLLVAGGVGLPPLYMQAARAAATGLAARSEMLYGGRGTPDLVLLVEMRRMGVALHLTTEDGSSGSRGLVTAALQDRLAHHRETPVRIMGCGPNAMLWAVGRIARDRGIPCFISLEEQMACGIGVCLGCAIPARSRPFRYVCSNGPVFDASDVLDVGTALPPAACVPSVPGS